MSDLIMDIAAVKPAIPSAVVEAAARRVLNQHAPDLIDMLFAPTGPSYEERGQRQLERERRQAKRAAK